MGTQFRYALTFASLVTIKTIDDYHRYTRHGRLTPGSSIKTFDGDQVNEVTINPFINHLISSYINVTFLGIYGVPFHVITKYIIPKIYKP